MLKKGVFSGIIGLLDESTNLNLRFYKVECVDTKNTV